MRPYLFEGVVSGLCLSAAVFSAGCELPAFVVDAPIEYVSVEIVRGDRGTLHRAAGLYYTIRNVSGKRIERLDVGFDLYASGSSYPEEGANSFTAVVAHPLLPGEESSFCTSLDEIVTGHAAGTAAAGSAPDPGDLEPARFRVRLVRYADGTVWRNTGALVFQGAGR